MKGVTMSSDCFHFVGRFAFEPNDLTGQRIDYTVTAPKYATNLKMVLYADTFDSWEEVRGSGQLTRNRLKIASSTKGEKGMTCAEKYARSDCFISLGNKTDAWLQSERMAWFKFHTNYNETQRRNYQQQMYEELSPEAHSTWSGAMTCSALQDPGFVYVALINHKSDGAVVPGEEPLWDGPLYGIQYEFRTRNMREDFTELSAHMRPVIPFLVVILVVEFIIILAGTKVGHALRSVDKFHTSLHALMWSIVFHAASLGCLTLHWFTYAWNGEGVMGLKITGELFFILADTCLLLVTIFIGKGWTIVRRKISKNGRTKIVIYACLYGGLLFGKTFWYNFAFDEGEAIYEWSTTPGYLAIACRLFALLWFGYAVRTTLKKYRAKKRFYLKFSLTFGGWIISTPVALLMVYTGLEYYRELRIFIVQHSLLAAAHVLYLLMFNPDFKHNRGFPFHQTTTPKGGGPREMAVRTIVAGGASQGEEELDEPIAKIESLLERIAQRQALLAEYATHLVSVIDELEAAGGRDDRGRDDRERDDRGRGRDDRGYDDRDRGYDRGRGGRDDRDRDRGYDDHDRGYDRGRDGRDDRDRGRGYDDRDRDRGHGGRDDRGRGYDDRDRDRGRGGRDDRGRDDRGRGGRDDRAGRDDRGSGPDDRERG